MEVITRELVKKADRKKVTSALFGLRFLWVESFVLDTAASLSADYQNVRWAYYVLSNGGFYLAPWSRKNYEVEGGNGFVGRLSADALGLTACIYAFALLARSPDPAFAALCVLCQDRLQTYAMGHPEAAEVRAVLD